VLVVGHAFWRDGAVGGVERHRRVGQHLGDEPVDVRRRRA
jgi:hypothetical protein